MSKVYVITGGGSGMGLATIAKLDKESTIVITGRTKEKLEKAADELIHQGYHIECIACDVSKKEDVKRLVDFSVSFGEIAAVIHSAGVSPHMGDAETILRINSLGTHYINQEFKKVMNGGIIINVSSMSAYLLPNMLLPIKKYPLIFKNEELFIRKCTKKAKILGKKQESNLGYPISKNFVCWYTKRIANEMYEKGIRVISVSPGNFETPMGNLESEQGKDFLKMAAIKRFGKVDEIASLFVALISPEFGYLTGTDIVCDGGTVGNLSVYSKKEQKSFKI